MKIWLYAVIQRGALHFEAKRDASYSNQRALDELDAARKNRGADVGVFVMAKSHASESFPTFARYGRNVLVTWDEQHPESEPYLRAAILLGLSLVTRRKKHGEEGDINALQDIGGRIETELSRLSRMEKHNDSVRKNSDSIGEEIRKASKALDLLLRRAKSTLTALNVELIDEDAERASPIALEQHLDDGLASDIPPTSPEPVLQRIPDTQLSHSPAAHQQ
ncbi:MAG: hypothetical protein H6716_25195 [Polyangiaceae bacterium]|nr:hypothetical protein [Polyangiaceae bacterium]